MANINAPVVETLTTQPIVNKSEYRGNAQIIADYIDNGTSGVNDGDTITFTDILPDNAVGISIHLKTAGVGASTTLTVSAGGTDLTAAIDTSSALDNTYLLSVAGSGRTDVAGSKIIGTVGGADWDDGANDLWYAITFVCDE